MRSLMRTDKNHQMKSKSISQNTFVYQIGKKKTDEIYNSHAGKPVSNWNIRGNAHLHLINNYPIVGSELKH